MAYSFQQKIEKYIDEKFVAIEQENQKKHEEFTVRIWLDWSIWIVFSFTHWIDFLFCLQNTANTHNDNLCREIRVMFENKMLNGIGNNYLSDDAFISLFMRSKVEALDDVSYCISLWSIVCANPILYFW